MHNYFIFKNISSEKFNILVNTLPDIKRPSARFSETDIAGRDGEKIEFLGYSNQIKSMKLTTYPERINEINAWLTGQGNVTFSNEPQMEYRCILIKDITWKKEGYHYTSMVELVCEPFKYLKNEKPTRELQIINKGTINSKPAITVYGSGIVSLYLNGSLQCTLSINDGYLTVDSRDEDVYKDGILKNTCMTGKFPELIPGINMIAVEGNVSAVETEIRSAWL